MSGGTDALATVLADAAALRRRVEAEPLPANYRQHLEQVAASHGSDLAWITIDGEGPNLTYGEVADAAARAAGAFYGQGVRKGQHVGVMLPNGPDFLTAWLGLAQLGAVLVPVNPKLTAHEADHVLADGDVDFILVAHDSLDLLETTATGASLMAKGRYAVQGCNVPERCWADLTGAVPEGFDTPERVTLDDPITILYTSGSTGKPKGCIHTHRYWLTLGKVKAALLPDCKRILCELPFYYMSPYYRFSAASFRAAAICVPPAPSLSKFYDRIARYDIDIVWIGDPMATTAISAGKLDHKLKYASLYGLKTELHGPLETALGIPVREAFGMTEVGAGLYVPEGAGFMSGSGSCGIPAPFRACVVADEKGNALPQGAIGELLISGPGLFKGYHKNPEANAAAFWGNWFRTGDLARVDENGFFYIVGRIKEMIKRSSENIAAQEVESAIYALPQVLETAVVGVPDALRGEEVKACIVLKDGFTDGDLPPDAIIAHCQERLAAFKVPRYIQYYSAFPKTSSEKIAKKLLADGAGVASSEVFDTRAK
jgi:acyl-coenzyme A synthetase/AMP-(fatty) acid ligase